MDHITVIPPSDSQQSIGWAIVCGPRVWTYLSWDEFLGQIAAMTMPVRNCDLPDGPTLFRPRIDRVGDLVDIIERLAAADRDTETIAADTLEKLQGEARKILKPQRRAT